MDSGTTVRQYTSRNWIRWAVPVVLSVLITLATYFHTWIEHQYSQGIYPWIGVTQRLLMRWIPISIGDLLYFIAAVWLLSRIIKTILGFVRKKITRQKTIRRTFRLARLLLWLYIIFSLLWGWNYHRRGLEYQLQLPTGPYQLGELAQVMDEVVVQLNENRRLISADSILPVRPFRELSQSAVQAYQAASAQFPFLEYRQPAIKESVYSAAALYFGFTGYYNPFTGEAQLRTHLPEIMKPFVICHEIGHQVGYARENEASFAGYLAALHSDDPYLRYSVYLELYSAIRSKMIYTGFDQGDTSVIRTLLPVYQEKLNTLVRHDMRKIREYFRRTRTPLSEQMSSVVMSMYEQYLRANAQAAGLRSYDDVVSLLVAFRRKWGRV